MHGVFLSLTSGSRVLVLRRDEREEGQSSERAVVVVVTIEHHLELTAERAMRIFEIKEFIETALSSSEGTQFYARCCSR